ncbi:MAG: hypothetical protein AAFQ82_10455 [Myxococcota bacterium]
MNNYVDIVPNARALLCELAVFPKLVVGRYPAYQDLVYQGQIARGLFVLTQGILSLRSHARAIGYPTSLEAGSSQGIILPAILQLDRSLPFTVATQCDCEIAFISRTQLSRSPQLRQSLILHTQDLHHSFESHVFREDVKQ